MRKSLCLVMLSVLASSPALAQDKPSARFSFGYAFAEYLEENGGSAPFGLYLSVASEATVGVDAEIAYHRDETDYFGSNSVLNTVTGMIGPRFAYTTGAAQPFGHILGGVRYDSIEREDDWSVGAEGGFGVDVEIGPSAYLRFGADFQIFFDEGEDFKVLRFAVGVAL